MLSKLTRKTGEEDRKFFHIMQVLRKVNERGGDIYTETGTNRLVETPEISIIHPSKIKHTHFVYFKSVPLSFAGKSFSCRIICFFFLLSKGSCELFGHFFNRFFDIKILTTSKVNRKAGLGRELIKRSTDLSKVLGFKAIKTEATGI